MIYFHKKQKEKPPAQESNLHFIAEGNATFTIASEIPFSRTGEV